MYFDKIHFLTIISNFLLSLIVIFFPLSIIFYLIWLNIFRIISGSPNDTFQKIVSFILVDFPQLYLQRRWSSMLIISLFVLLATTIGSAESPQCMFHHHHHHRHQHDYHHEQCHHRDNHQHDKWSGWSTERAKRDRLTLPADWPQRLTTIKVWPSKHNTFNTLHYTIQHS